MNLISCLLWLFQQLLVLFCIFITRIYKLTIFLFSTLSFKFSYRRLEKQPCPHHFALTISSLLTSVLLFLYLLNVSKKFILFILHSLLYLVLLVIYMFFFVFFFSNNGLQTLSSTETKLSRHVSIFSVESSLPSFENLVKFTIYILRSKFCFVSLTFRFIPLILTFKVHTVSIRYRINGDYLT